MDEDGARTSLRVRLFGFVKFHIILGKHIIASNSILLTHFDPPIQEKSMAMLLCFVLGVGFLFPWGTILTIDDYYYHVFPNYHPSRVLSVTNSIFTVATLGILACNEAKINTRKRNVLGYTFFTMTMLGLLLIDVGASGKGGIGTYVCVCVMAAIIGLANSLVGGGISGDLSFMCPAFNQSFFVGMAASGALTSGFRLITRVVFEQTKNGLRNGVLLFLAIATFFEFVCIFLYGFVFGKLSIVKDFRKQAASQGSKTVLADLVAVGIHTTGEMHDRLSNKKLLLQNIDHLINIYVTFALSMSIIPGFLYENTGRNHALGSWYRVVLVAVNSLWDLIGRCTPFIDHIRFESRKGLLIASFARFLFIPCFYFVAKYGDGVWMIFLVSSLGLSHGYLTVSIVRLAPKGYMAPEQNAIGNLLEFFINFGILSGLSLDWLWII